MLEKWLKKIGVKSYDELNEEEKKTYREYEEVLSGRKLTDKEVNDWLESELEIAVSRLTDIDLKKEDEIFRKVEVRFIKKILNFINSPVVAKEFAEKSIEQMMK
jgi:hypothetical protein